MTGKNKNFIELSRLEAKDLYHGANSGVLRLPIKLGKFHFLYFPEISLVFFQYDRNLVSGRHSVRAE